MVSSALNANRHNLEESREHSRYLPIRQRLPLMSNALFMRVLQNEAMARLATPLDDVERFMNLTSGAPVQDQIASLYLDALRQHDATLLADLSELRDGTAGRQCALAIAAVRANVLAAAERSLDDLQLSIQSNWNTQARLIALAAGIVIALSLGIGARVITNDLVEPAIFPLVFALGAVACATINERFINLLLPMRYSISDFPKTHVMFGFYRALLHRFHIMLLAVVPLSAIALAVATSRSPRSSVSGYNSGFIDMVVVGFIAGCVAPAIYQWFRLLFSRRA